MTESPPTPKMSTTNIPPIRKPHDKSHNKFTDSQSAKTFITWYKHMIDNERPNLGLYLSDDTILEWFGRTIKTRKKVSAFLKYDMQCSRHDFVSIRSIDKIRNRQDKIPGKEETKLSTVQHSPEVIRSRNDKRKAYCISPEWAEGCQPLDEEKDIPSKKKFKTSQPPEADIKCDNISQRNGIKRSFDEDGSDFNSKGDGIWDRRVKRKLVSVTPPNCELGQGECMPSTSGADSDRSHEVLNAQLPKLYVECNGYIQFMRTRNSNIRDAAKWERKCKAQISYSEDPLNIGEYIIWAIHYTDDSKCRRNLLSAFEEVAKEELKNMSINS